MKVKKIEYPTHLRKTLDDGEENIDVFVTLENNRSYCLTVCTLSWLTEQVKQFGYAKPGVDIVVSEFKCDVIGKAIEEFARDDAYWLRLYSVSCGDEIPN